MLRNFAIVLFVKIKDEKNEHTGDAAPAANGGDSVDSCGLR